MYTAQCTMYYAQCKHLLCIAWNYDHTRFIKMFAKFAGNILKFRIMIYRKSIQIKYK